MSDYQQIVDDLVVKWNVAIPGVVFEDESTPPDQIGPDKLPHLQVATSVETSEPLEFQQVTQRFSITFQYTTKGASQSEIWAQFDAMRDQVHGDRRLGANVENSEVTERQVYPRLEDRWIATFTVETERVR